MRIGIVFDQTSTNEFLVMLDSDLSDEQLLFSYIELRRANNERIIARITNVYKENPLLSKDQAGAAAGRNLSQLGFDFAKRFTYGWATCSVLGAIISSNNLDMNRRVIMPNEEVYTPSKETLQQLFFNASPSYIPIGEIETIGQRGDNVSVPITLDADQMVTKHFCVFGMTGSGKTNTAAKILEELMARGHRMVIFDSHDDYLRLEHLSNLFRDRNPLTGESFDITCDAPEFIASADYITTKISRELGSLPQNHLFRKPDFDLSKWVKGRLLQTASIVAENMPSRDLAREQGSGINERFVKIVLQHENLQSLLTKPRVKSYVSFPQIKFYGARYQDFTIQLISAIQGEHFSSAQWRWLRGHINQPGTGTTYISNVINAIRVQRNQNRGRQNNQPGRSDSTLEVLEQRFEGLLAIYNEAVQAQLNFIEFDRFFLEVSEKYEDVANKKKKQTNPENVYRISLAHLSSNVRKAFVYGVITFFFRKFKYDGFRATGDDANAYPVLFVLEEARSLIPKSSGFQDEDASGDLARRAMREIAYEGRKFSLGFGLISQKPASVDQEIVSQANTFILHQLKSPDDQQYVRSVTESMSADELEMIKSLGTGRAIVAGVAVKSPILVRLHYRYSEEGIPEPTPIKDSFSGFANIRASLLLKDND